MSNYEMIDILFYWNVAELASYQLEYVGGPEWDYESPDMVYTGLLRQSDDKSFNKIEIYRKKN